MMGYKKNTKTTAGQARHLLHVTSGAIARQVRGGCNAHADGAHKYRGAAMICKCGTPYKR
jgi:hypothetical protein